MDFVVDCVSAALASMAIFVVSPKAASLCDGDFLQAAAATLVIDTDKVTRDCQRAQMAAKREANLPNRFNAERVKALYHGDPE